MDGLNVEYQSKYRAKCDKCSLYVYGFFLLIRFSVVTVSCNWTCGAWKLERILSSFFQLSSPVTSSLGSVSKWNVGQIGQEGTKRLSFFSFVDFLSSLSLLSIISPHCCRHRSRACIGLNLSGTFVNFMKCSWIFESSSTRCCDDSQSASSSVKFILDGFTVEENFVRSLIIVIKMRDARVADIDSDHNNFIQ